jgi:hypothetical protein
MKIAAASRLPAIVSTPGAVLQQSGSPRGSDVTKSMTR